MQENNPNKPEKIRKKKKKKLNRRAEADFQPPPQKRGMPRVIGSAIFSML